MPALIIPFPVARMKRIPPARQQADYCGLQVDVIARGPVNTLVAYDNHPGWVPSGSLRDIDARPSDTEEAQT